jgi:hypothetical protein
VSKLSVLLSSAFLMMLKSPPIIYGFSTYNANLKPLDLSRRRNFT